MTKRYLATAVSLAITSLSACGGKPQIETTIVDDKLADSIDHAWGNSHYNEQLDTVRMSVELADNSFGVEYTDQTTTYKICLSQAKALVMSSQTGQGLVQCYRPYTEYTGKDSGIENDNMLIHCLRNTNRRGVKTVTCTYDKF